MPGAGPPKRRQGTRTRQDHPRNGLKTALNKWPTVAYGGRSGRATQGYTGGPAAPLPDPLGRGRAPAPFQVPALAQPFLGRPVVAGNDQNQASPEPNTQNAPTRPTRGHSHATIQPL